VDAHIDSLFHTAVQIATAFVSERRTLLLNQVHDRKKERKKETSKETMPVP
jgi:hypothetical protein